MLSTKEKSITIYEPSQRLKVHTWKSLTLLCSNTYQYRQLIFRLFKRDYASIYRQSFIGGAWIFLFPLIQSSVWLFLNFVGVINPGETEVPYPIYLFTGTTAWLIFNGTIAGASRTLYSAIDLLNHINYPHEIYLIKETLQALANFFIILFINLIILFIMGYPPSWKTLLVPFVALPLILLASGIGLILSMPLVIARDIEKGFDLFIQALMYSVPVIYSTSLGKITELNPLTYLVCSIRDMILYGRLYDNMGYTISSVFAILTFIFCWRLFYIAEKEITERIMILR